MDERRWQLRGSRPREAGWSVFVALVLLVVAAFGQEGIETPGGVVGPKPGVLPARNEATYRAILDAVKDPNRDVRDIVAWSIARMGRADAIATLNAMAKEHAPEARAAALRAMKDILPPRSRVAVALDVPVEDPALRLEALAAAQSLLFDRREELIRAGLKSESAVERALAVEALVLDAPEESRPMLSAALQDREPTVRAAALRVLGASGGVGAVPTVLPFLSEKTSDRSFVVRAAACEALGRIKPTAMPNELGAAMTDEHFLVRRSAVQAAARIRDPASASALHERVIEKDYTVREAACVALGVIIVPSSAPLLSDRLADEIAEVRTAAMISLVAFPPVVAHAAVLKHVDDATRPETRRRAWWVMGEHAIPAASEIAYAHLDDTDPEVHAAALRILRKLEDRRIIPHVNKLLHFVISAPAPPDQVVVECYQAAILFKLVEPVPSAIFAIKECVKAQLNPPPFQPSITLGLWAARYLAALDRKEAVPAIERLMGEVGGEEAAIVSEVLERLTGRKYPVRPPPRLWQPFFIEIKEPGEK